MARSKPAAVRRTPSDLHFQSNGKVYQDGLSEKPFVDKVDPHPDANGVPHSSTQQKDQKNPLMRQGFASLLFCVGGIYATL